MRDGSQHLEQLIVQFKKDRRDRCSNRDIAGNEALYLQLHHDTFVQGYIAPCHPVLTFTWTHELTASAKKLF
jgi:hypothetical protein